MTETLTVEPRTSPHTFLRFPLCTEFDRLEADIAILGLPYGDPYGIDEVTNDQTNAPTAVRRQSLRLSYGLDRWDFDCRLSAAADGRCHLIAVLEGAVRIEGDPADSPLPRGGTALLPASLGNVRLTAQGRTILLDVYLP